MIRLTVGKTKNREYEHVRWLDMSEESGMEKTMLKYHAGANERCELMVLYLRASEISIAAENDMS